MAKLSLGDFVASGNGSWADDAVDDNLPLPSAPTGGDGNSGYNDYLGGGGYHDKPPSYGGGGGGYGGGGNYNDRGPTPGYNDRGPAPGYNDRRSDRPNVPIPSEPPFTAFVGNFPYECSQDDVIGLFRECQIADVRTVRGRDMDRPRGYFIEFEDVQSLERALTFDNHMLGSRPLRVNVAEARPPRRDSFDRGPRGGGGGFADRYNERSGGGFAERYDRDDRRSGGGYGGGRGGGGYHDRDDRRNGGYGDDFGAGYGGFERGGHGGRGGGGGNHDDDRGKYGDRDRRTSFTGGGYQEPRSRGGGGGGGGYHGDDRPQRRSRDSGNDRRGGGGSGVPEPDSAPAAERPRLVLKPRSATANAGAAPPSQSGKPNPFGSARPVDTTAKEAEAERKMREEKNKTLQAGKGSGVDNAGSKSVAGGNAGAQPQSAVPAPQNRKERMSGNGKPKGPIMAPPEPEEVKAKNAFELLSMDDDEDREEEE